MRADRSDGLKTRHRGLVTALVAGVALLWPLPLGGALLMVTASIGLAVSWESALSVLPIGEEAVIRRYP